MWLDLKKYSQDTPKYHILYFNKNIDIKFAPKAGSRSIRKYWTAAIAYKKNIDLISYWNRINSPSFEDTLKSTYIPDLHNMFLDSKYQKFVDSQVNSPFRENSYKIAIYRNPIDRWISACEYHYQLTKNSYLKFDYEIDDIIYMHQKGIIIPTISQFKPMTYWLGEDKSIYNATYDVKNINELMQELNILLGVDIDPIWEHRQIYEKYHKSNLTSSQILAIKNLYAVDYTNGWCSYD
jgi:hypothetical protein